MLKHHFIHLFDHDMRVAVGRDRPPIIKVITKLAVAAAQKVRFQMDSRHTIVSSRALVASDLGFGNADGTFRHVINNTDSLGNTGADNGPGAIDAVVVEHLDPVVIFDAEFLGIDLAHPARFASAGQGQHPEVVAIRRVDVPFAVRRQDI